ncbi:MAG: hypothetical protein LBF09_00585 [Odoribacteraceae bacterium]|nr:hypothetical protein [Odoribacteraceae bacterium]
METFITYIEELVYLHDQVVIPGLGTLVARPGSAVIKRGVVFPPSRVVSFNRHARHDDGILAGWVARREGIDARKANARVARFRDSLLDRLEGGETVAVGSCGSFSAGRGGRLLFHSSGRDLLADVTGMLPLPLARGEEIRVGSGLITRIIGYGISAAVITGIIAISQSGLFRPDHRAENATLQPAPPVKERVITRSPVIVSPRHDFVDYTPAL